MTVMLMTIPPFLAAFVWVITVVCVSEWGTSARCPWPWGGILLAVFFLYTRFLAFFSHFNSPSLSLLQQSLTLPTFFPSFFFAFYLRRKPPFFMRANYAALSIPLSPFLPRSPSLSHPWGVGEAHPHNENLRIRKNVDCSLSQLWHTKWIYSAFFFNYTIFVSI